MQKLDDIWKRRPEDFKTMVLKYASSDSPIENLNAVLYGAKYKLSDERFILALHKMLDSDARFFGTPLSSFVQAALDVLGVQKYSGDDDYVMELIQSEFQQI